MKIIIQRLLILYLLLPGVLYLNGCKKLEKVAMVLTEEVTDTASYTAKAKGQIIDPGEGTYKASGVCWATTIDPAISNSKTTDGSESGTFTSNITGLSPATTYHVRAYFTSTINTVYGEDRIFTTKGLPAINTTFPVRDAGNVLVNAVISATFNQNMDISTINTSSFILKDGSTAVTGSVGYSGVMATFMPSKNLTAGTIYTATLTTGVKASGGTALAQNYEWSFTTMSIPGSPSSLIAAPVSGYQINLSWNDNSNNEDGFRIERSPDGISGWIEISSVNANVTSFSNSGLLPGSSYFYRIRAFNMGGNSIYSNVNNATTLELPASATASANGVSSKKAIVNGTVNAKGLSTSVTFEYGPTIDYGSSVTSIPSSVMGTSPTSVSAEIPDLNPGQLYHYRVKATSIGGTSYGGDFIFTTPDQVQDREGNIYNAVIIGDQIWMAENLKTTAYNDGWPIPYISDNSSWSATTSAAYCWYNNDAANNDIYGALYNFYAVTANHNLCPTGWRIPLDSDWIILESYLGGKAIAGGKLMAVTGWFDQPGVTNYSGFTALPGGHRMTDGVFNNFGFMANFWSPVTANASNSYGRQLYYQGLDVGAGFSEANNLGFSVRCLRN